MLPWCDHDSSSASMHGGNAPEKVYAFRPSIPPTPEEASDLLLEKLEQAGRVPSKDKFRRMACNTFIFTGACPYNDRCVFLHDYRIKAEGVRVRTTRQTRANNAVKDTFYWPDMTRKDVIRNPDAQGLPSANQMYIVPDAFGANPHNFHNRGLYSIWSHFVEFCMHNSVFYVRKYRDVTTEPFFQTSAYRENPHVPGAKRLETFVQLSMGVPVGGWAQRIPSALIAAGEGSSAGDDGDELHSLGWRSAAVPKKYATTADHLDATQSDLLTPLPHPWELSRLDSGTTDLLDQSGSYDEWSGARELERFSPTHPSYYAAISADSDTHSSSRHIKLDLDDLSWFNEAIAQAEHTQVHPWRTESFSPPASGEQRRLRAMVAPDPHPAEAAPRFAPSLFVVGTAQPAPTRSPALSGRAESYMTEQAFQSQRRRSRSEEMISGYGHQHPHASSPPVHSPDLGWQQLQHGAFALRDHSYFVAPPPTAGGDAHGDASVPSDSDSASDGRQGPRSGRSPASAEPRHHRY